MESKFKRILILHGSSDLYGASKILVNTVIGLIQEEYHVIVVLSSNGPLVDKLRQLGVDVAVIKLGILRRKYFSIKGMCNRAAVIFSSQRKLLQIVKDNDIRIIYSNTAAVLIGAIVAKRAKVKHVWHIHEIIEKPVFFSKFIGALLVRCDVALMVSNEVKKHWENVVGGDQPNFKVIYNGLDYTPYLNADSSLREELNISSEKMLIGMIGRVNNWKGQKYFLQIAALLNQRFDNLHFIMAGDAYPGYEYLYDEINLLKREIGIQDVVHDLGYRTDVHNILAGLDVFILPSTLPDPLPTVVLEAMGSAKPVVATAHGGALEMVEENKTGIFIPWDNPDIAASLIAKLITENRLKEYGASGRQRALHSFSLSSYKRNILAALEELVD